MLSRTWNRWTSAQDDKLEQMYSDPSIPLESIAQLVGHTARAVKVRAERKGLRRRQINPYCIVSDFFICIRSKRWAKKLSKSMGLSMSVVLVYQGSIYSGVSTW